MMGGQQRLGIRSARSKKMSLSTIGAVLLLLPLTGLIGTTMVLLPSPNGWQTISPTTTTRHLLVMEDHAREQRDNSIKNKETTPIRNLIKSSSNKESLTSKSTSSSITKDEIASSPIRIFVGIKTREVGLHGERLPQIQQTWLPDALEASQITIRFFADKTAESLTEATKSDIHDSDTTAIYMEPLTVHVEKCSGTDISCKTAAMFDYFLKHNDHDNIQADYFCNFDDDNYIVIHNLISVLEGYHAQHDRRDHLYVGRHQRLHGYPLGPKFDNITVQHLTGGAGYCLSRSLVERGKEWFIAPPHGLPDDIAVGYIVQEKLKISSIEDFHFHSHYDQNTQQTMPLADVSKQVSFGFNNKHDRDFARKSMPGFPILFTPAEDPLLFKSLRCFLLRQEGAGTVTNEQCPLSQS